MRIQTSLLFLAWLGGSVAGIAADAPPFIGELIDGTKITGVGLKGVQEAPAAWKLDTVPLFGDNPLRWLNNRSLSRGTPPSSFVEFRNGDVLPGEVSRHVARGPAGDVTEPYLTFSTSAWPDVQDSPRRFGVVDGRLRQPGASLRTLRLDPSQARRIVWQRRTNDFVTPKTIYYRDGRTVAYRSLKWEETAVKILTEQGPSTITFDEIAELHLEASDPWSDYTRQLAILMPELHGRIVQLEGEGGIRITAATDRFQMPGVLTRNIRQPVPQQVPISLQVSLQAVQPAWSFDPIVLDLAKIHARRYFGPHEVPLSALTPSAIEQSGELARSWRPIVDHNVQGGPLMNGGSEYGWGWGVHAFNRLEFELPPFARTFQTKIGLDQIAGKGGCAKATVSCISGGDHNLFTSPVLIGSRSGANTSQLDLPDVGKKDRKLVLLADPLLKDHPPGTDPLEIGDMLDWLEPLLLLDPQRLREDVSQQVLELAKRKQDERDPQRENLAQFAPGFEPGQPELGIRLQPMPDGTNGITLQPGPMIPQLLRRLVEVPAQKTTKLRISMGGTGGPVNMAVLANGTLLVTFPPTIRTNQAEPTDIDLTQFAGRRVALEIDIGDARNAATRFKKIEIISTDPPQPPEEKKP